MKKVLLIEDSELFYNLFRRVLDDYEIVWAPDGKSGMEYFVVHNPDLVVVDLILPDLNGIDVIKKIREINSTTPVVVLSGIEKREVIKDIMKVGATAYVPKSVGIRTLKEKLEMYLQDKNQNSSAGHLPRQSKQ